MKKMTITFTWENFTKNIQEDATNKKILFNHFNNYKMVVNRPAIKQIHEMKMILNIWVLIITQAYSLINTLLQAYSLLLNLIKLSINEISNNIPILNKVIVQLISLFFKFIIIKYTSIYLRQNYIK